MRTRRWERVGDVILEKCPGRQAHEWQRTETLKPGIIGYVCIHCGKLWPNQLPDDEVMAEDEHGHMLPMRTNEDDAE
jgi:hypothetical protein